MHCKVVTNRFDCEDIYMGKINAREYIKMEGGIIDVLLKFFFHYDVIATGFERRAPIDGRYRIICPPQVGFAIRPKGQKKLLKEIFRKKYWMFICLSNRIGVHIQDDSDITLSNINDNDICILKSCNIKLEDASYLEVDEIYFCDHYNRREI